MLLEFAPVHKDNKMYAFQSNVTSEFSALLLAPGEVGDSYLILPLQVTTSSHKNGDQE